MANFFKNLNFNFQHLLALIIVVTCFGYFFYISGTHFATVQNNNVVDVKTAMISILTMVAMHYFRQEKRNIDDPSKPE
ncbi:hypothetical protein [Chitinophaga sp. sic0106]|uniref:hypothetical protein n=1 Tax=Chitinophaga sp. sic0106 TaxID=2854785 RepID=UPI001C4438EE|nr:hypothetical protein [Chitinophaga sp. sic0106]MBV7531352.1 hypothetical protein [Chitinophaga sp. sic0106]MBV7534042.1 hypothetical protein [Chitinophaga sp. sic0106]